MERHATRRESPAKDTFDRYVRDLETAVPLSAEEESEHAARIQSARLDLWAALLSYPPLAGPIASLCGERFEEPTVQEAARALSRAAKSARHTRTTRGGEAFRAAGAELGAALVSCDQDDTVATAVARDVDALVHGRGEVTVLRVTRLPSLNRPFLAYVDRVCAANEALRGAKVAFAQANLRLVVHMARRFERSTVPLTDLIQEGNLGLMRAVDRFDHTRGFRFSTYATWWIRHSLNRAILNTGRLVRVPVHVVERQRQIVDARARLGEALGRDATDAEIAEELGLTVEKVVRTQMAIARRSRSIDAPVASANRGTTTLAEVLPDDAEPLEEQVEWAELHEHLDALLGELDAVELDIVQRRFGLGGRRVETLREVGESYGLSRERIRQLQAKALEKMRAALAA